MDMKDEKKNICELKFKGKNPGAVRFGNFINYYQFHSPQSRIDLLPKQIWNSSEQSSKQFFGLDIGCNAGNLTFLLHSFLEEVTKQNCFILGIDIDPILIERANEQNNSKQIHFLHVDFMKENNRKIIGEYLMENCISKFSAVFCFSITMWIHLNYGDEGLHNFIREVFKLGKIIVIEPQPWKCYRAAVKRMKLSNEHFPLFENLKLRNNIEEHIKSFISNEFGSQTTKITETDANSWGRKLLIYKWNDF